MKLSKSQENFPQFQNKKVLIMGLGLHGGGVGAVNFFAQAGAKVTVTDLRTRRQLKESITQLKDLPIKYILGKHRENDFKNADLIIRNPAVPDDSPYLKIAQKHKVPTDTDVGIFFAALRAATRRVELCPVPMDSTSSPQVIGITGTRGKSTTSTLIYEFLKTKYPNAVLAGNIRQSVLLELPRLLRHCEKAASRRSNLDGNQMHVAIPRADFVEPRFRRDCFVATTPRNDIPHIILELSSWQVEGLAAHKQSPHIAVITTIQPDHLNRYKGMNEYIAAKKLIFKYQTTDDFLFLNKDDKIVKGFAKQTKSKVIFYSANEAKKYKSRLLGEHNLANIAAAIKVVKHFGIGKNAIKKTLKNFQGLTGRLELIRKINGVKYINDTCATTPDAAIAAINAVTNYYLLPSSAEGGSASGGKHLTLIAGGADKNLDFAQVAKIIVRKVNTLILLEGTATDKFENAIKLNSKIVSCKLKIVRRVDSMEKAVKLAASRAQKGDTVLLSPACASFGLFRHEFERGKAFKKAVKSIK